MEDATREGFLCWYKDFKPSQESVYLLQQPDILNDTTLSPKAHNTDTLAK